MESKEDNNTVFSNKEKIGHDELYDLLTSNQVSWQAIIYDLIKSEQLDPWDIDLARLARAYIEKIKDLEEANFFVSSKILLAAAILLRIKSELLLKKYIKSLDEILFGKPEEKEKPVFNFELDEDISLLPKTPMPRLRKVTINELMASLNKAMMTEHRRIKKEISEKQAIREARMILPRFRINIREKIREIYLKIRDFLRLKPQEKMSFSQLSGATENKREKIATFVPLLHLTNQQRVNLEQEKHFDEIFIYLNK